VPFFLKQLGRDVRSAMAYSEEEGGDWPDGAAFIDIDRGTRIHLLSKKGNDPNEWPEDLRVRQYPEASQ
jgi:hypothetical protein